MRGDDDSGGLVDEFREEVSRWLRRTDLTDLRLGVVSTDGSTVLAPTSDKTAILTALNTTGDERRNFYLGPAISGAHSLLMSTRGSSPYDQAIVLMGTKDPPDRAADSVRAAVLAQEADIEMYVVVLSPMSKRLASSPRHFFGFATDPDDDRTRSNMRRAAAQALRALYDSVVPRAFETVSITSTVPVEFTYEPDSARPPAAWNPATRTLSWSFADPPSTSTVAYEVSALKCGTFDLPRDSWAWGRDREGNTYRYDYSPVLFESLCPTATPSPTATPEPTDLPPPTATAVDTPTLALLLYLPVALHEPACTPDKRRVDVALVIDASTSMLQSTVAGRTKFAAAKEAADNFLDLLGPEDQAAIVAFNSEARLLQSLTNNRAALVETIAGIGAAPQTCLVCAVDVAATELTGSRRRSEATAVLILLTDGKSNPAPGKRGGDQGGRSEGRRSYDLHHRTR